MAVSAAAQLVVVGYDLYNMGDIMGGFLVHEDTAQDAAQSAGAVIAVGKGVGKTPFQMHNSYNVQILLYGSVTHVAAPGPLLWDISIVGMTHSDPRYWLFFGERYILLRCSHAALN